MAATRASSPLPARRLQGVWLPNPVPDPAEPRKRWRFVTDTDRLSDRAVARMLRRSSLWPIDRTFNMLRRRVAMFERPVASVRRARRSWQIYALCDPGMVNQTLEIFRAWHNWLWRRPKDGRTAAERLGLAQGEVRIDHVMGFDMREAVERLWDAEIPSPRQAMAVRRRSRGEEGRPLAGKVFLPSSPFHGVVFRPSGPVQGFAASRFMSILRLAARAVTSKWSACSTSRTFLGRWATTFTPPACRMLS